MGGHVPGLSGDATVYAHSSEDVEHSEDEEERFGSVEEGLLIEVGGEEEERQQGEQAGYEGVDEKEVQGSLVQVVTL